MKRDMELMRKILFAIEQQYKPGDGMIFCLQVDGFDMNEVAEHCDLLFQQKLIKLYEATWADHGILYFQVGNLSSQGFDYLELIRNDQVWLKTTEEIKKKKLPQTIEGLAKIAGIFTGEVIKSINS